MTSVITKVTLAIASSPNESLDSSQGNLLRGIANKVENIYEDSLDLIPSPSNLGKIRIIGGKVYLR